MLKRGLGAVTLASIGSVISGLLLAALAHAETTYAVDGQIGLQTPVTQVARDIVTFYDWVTWLIIAIAVFVLILMLYVMFRFKESSNPTPSTTTHNTVLEVAWTVIPIFILVAVAVPSFKLLNLQYDYPKPDLTIKATGYQWYWGHEYPDHEGISFDSVMLTDEEREEAIASGLEAPRNLAVDNEVVVPVNKVVHVLVTAADVIHNWTIPAFGSKTDGVPGRVTATWFKAEKEGVYYGQCSELCGINHAFMPIAVRVVKEDVFNAWIEAMKAEDEDKAKEIIRQAALELAGQKKLAAASKESAE